MSNNRNLVYFVLMSFFTLSLHAQDVRFVNHAATGNNDGSTWENAFTSLDTALARAQNGDLIWIATGTYRPGGDNGMNESSFVIDKSLRIFGGFAGDETSVDERDVANNPVILNGDHLDNDVSVQDSASRVDNSWHIVRVESGIQEVVRISDLIFSGGSTRDNRDIPLEFAGGALFAQSQIIVTNSRFENNYGLSGGCIALGGSGAENSQIENCTFTNNFSDAQSACIFLENCNNVSIENCFFTENLVTRGVIYPLYCFGTEINNCTFTDNACLGSTAFGGVFFSWNSINSNVSNSTFTGNECGNGGVAYIDGSELLPGDISVIWNNCTFERSRAGDWGGGAIYNWRCTQIIDDCIFDSNTATNTGGAIYNGGNNKAISISNTEFIDNAANGGWGGAHAIYGDSTSATIENCRYEGNMAITSGGAVTSGFRATVDYKACSFEANVASFGGAAYTQNDSTHTSFDSCSFLGNNASTLGGAVTITAGGNHSITNCLFELNVCEDAGGAMSISDADFIDTDTCFILVDRCRLIQNLAETQGAGISTSNTMLTLTNSEITDNSGLGTGYGAAISHNTSSGMESIMRINNSTIANNTGLFVQGIAGYTDTASTGRVILTNSILYHPGGTDWGVEAGTPSIHSEGGNLVSDNTLIDTFTQTNDLVSDMPGFVNANNGDYHLTDGSPAVNSAITDLAPDTDIEGNPRVGEADKGAYENQNVVSTRDQKSPLKATILPNPATDFIQIKLDGLVTKDLNCHLYQPDGKLIKSLTIEAANQEVIRMSIDDVPAGSYMLEISNAKEFGCFTVIKK